MQIVVEIAQYLTSQPEPMGDVIAYWKRNSQLGIFPLLTQLASVHLTAAASSVPVEQMFSITSLILNSRRSSMGSETLNKLSFIHDHFNLLSSELNK